MFKNLSVIIPVFNEVNTIKEIIMRVEAVELNGDIEKEIIIIDDGSTDGTTEILDAFKKSYKIIFLKKNKGKGAAVKKGFEASRGDIVLIQDADFEYDPADYSSLLKPILQEKADVVYGSRLMTTRPHRVLFYWHYVANMFLTTLSNMLTNLNLTDMETGYKVFTRRVIDKITPQLKSKRFGIEPELTALVARHRFKVYEVGISYYGRSYKEGKKIGWRDGLAAVWYILKYNLFH